MKKIFINSGVVNSNSKHSESMNDVFMVVVRGPSNNGYVRDEPDVQYNKQMPREKRKRWLNVHYFNVEETGKFKPR